jgi:hypothetical protein
MSNKDPIAQNVFNPWHFIWISVVVSELFTALLNTLQYVLFIKTNLAQLLLAGVIDALFVPLIVAPIIIYFVMKRTELLKINECLQKEIDERTRSQGERDKLIHELKDAFAKIKTLSGMLPICASCRKIRDDKGHWSSLEIYISTHTDTVFSHGICPDCEKKAYAELEKLK